MSKHQEELRAAETRAASGLAPSSNNQCKHGFHHEQDCFVESAAASVQSSSACRASGMCRSQMFLSSTTAPPWALVMAIYRGCCTWHRCPCPCPVVVPACRASPFSHQPFISGTKRIDSILLSKLREDQLLSPYEVAQSLERSDLVSTDGPESRRDKKMSGWEWKKYLTPSEHPRF